MLRKLTQGQRPAGPETHADGNVRDDAPLPGPWDRRAERDQDSPLPGPWDRPLETGGDESLPGPWDRKQEREIPVEAETYEMPDYQPAPAPRREQSSPREAADEPFGLPEKPRQAERPKPAVEPGVAPHSTLGEAAPAHRDSAVAATTQPPGMEHRHHQRQNPLKAVLSGQSTLVGSMVLGQVLGTRGGRAKHRR